MLTPDEYHKHLVAVIGALSDALSDIDGWIESEYGGTKHEVPMLERLKPKYAVLRAAQTAIRSDEAIANLRAEHKAAQDRAAQIAKELAVYGVTL